MPYSQPIHEGHPGGQSANSSVLGSESVAAVARRALYGDVGGQAEREIHSAVWLQRIAWLWPLLTTSVPILPASPGPRQSTLLVPCTVT